MSVPGYAAKIVLLKAAIAVDTPFSIEEAAAAMTCRVGEARRVLRVAVKAGTDDIARAAGTKWVITA